MNKCVILNLIDNNERLTTMKCPFCGIEMKKIVQTYPAKYGIPDLVQYDHKNTGKCKNGDGHTLTENIWKERKTKS
jgi:hypothetical protein